ncbi:lipopolysaccharide heptosyltransferase family protein [Oceanimonas baumannii]|uniref:glycosyltransferase family 9 protein n=1 Tax=Oceanimonas baumannii TaxID=129578 RepID=UPI001D1804C0|nr:glycosyltransferase family 9 protein [Oceanimonas baumannii]MCC4263495.1 lipopolysaccharide heptosyltransferase family protein [Oceanimonas baumannii]
MFDKASGGGDLGNIKRILVIRWDAKIGDSIVSSFFFRELKKHHKNIKVDVITAPHMAAMYQEHFGVDHVYCCKKRPGYSELKALAHEIGTADLVIHLSKQLKMKDIYFLRCLGADNVMGMDDELDVVNIKLGHATKGLHFSEKFAYALKLLGVSSPDRRYVIPEDVERQSRIKKEWPEQPVISINPYGSGSARRLNFDNVSMLVDLITKYKPGWKICLMSTPDTKTETEQWCDQLDTDNVFTVQSSETIQDAIEIVRLSAAVISVDTAIIHISSGLNKPLVGIYNPDEENFAEWHPNSDRSINVFSSESKLVNVNLLDAVELDKVISKLMRECC